MKIEPDGVYTLQEAAEYLRVNLRTLQREAVTGKILAFRVGRQWRFYGRDLLALTAKRDPQGTCE
jgi:excisionase family DNA binding protein